MSISTKLQQFRDINRVCINDKFMGDEGASQLANFLNSHRKVQSLQIKSNDISPQGFLPLFDALVNNPSLKELNVQYNNLGVNDYVQWHDGLINVIGSCRKLQRINLSNNKISGQAFSRILQAIAESRSLKLLEIRYNNIGNQQIQQFVKQLSLSHNETLLFVELTGNKIKKQTIESLQSYLNKNRKKNPITKDKLMNITIKQQGPSVDADHSYANNRNGSKINNTLDQIPHDSMVKYLQDILDQNRRDMAENKIRLEQQLAELQQRQKLDSLELNQIDKRCNQIIIVNRNLKFELDRTLGEHQQLQRDQQSHLRLHQQKIKEASKELQDLQDKYEDLESRMNKEHQIKMKQIVRDWEARLRNVQQKIRSAQNDNVNLENQIRKILDKRQRTRLECVEQQNYVRGQIQTEETHRFNFKIKDLESQLRQAQESGDGYMHRNQELVYELEKSQIQNKKQIDQLQEQLIDLRAKQNQFNAKNKDFFTKNQKIKADIQMKQITIQKLQQQINRLDKQIEAKKLKQQMEINKVKQSFEFTRFNRTEQKNNRMKKLHQLENALRTAQLQSAKLRQEYGLLAQKLQVNISLAVHKVFQQNSLY